TAPVSAVVKPDGSYMALLGTQNDRLRGYTLSPANQVSSANLVHSSGSVAAQSGTMASAVVRADGLKAYMVSILTDNTIWEYTLSTAWNVSTLTFTTAHTITSSTTFNIHFKPDGTKMYVNSNSILNQFTLSTPWD